jgi:hypothetical protein
MRAIRGRQASAYLTAPSRRLRYLRRIFPVGSALGYGRTPKGCEHASPADAYPYFVSGQPLLAAVG